MKRGRRKAAPGPAIDLEDFLRPFTTGLRRSENRQAFERYISGLLSSLARKTASDMGRALDDTSSQRLQEFLTRTPWNPADVNRARIQEMLANGTSGSGRLVIGEIAFEKDGTGSVGVDRQFAPSLRRRANCQIIVMACYSDQVFDWPVGARLFLPESWANDPVRREKARVPSDVVFQTKGEIAVALLDEAMAAGVRPSTVIVGPAVGTDPAFEAGLEVRGIPYVAELMDDTEMRPSGEPAGREVSKARSAASIIDSLPSETWTRMAWRDGPYEARVRDVTRVRAILTAPRHAQTGWDGWLMGVRPLRGYPGNPACYFARGLDDASLEDLVALADRWPLSEFDRYARSQLGIHHYEGRLWSGLHRHLTLVQLAHSFQILRTAFTGARERGNGRVGQPSAPRRGEAEAPTLPAEALPAS